MQKVKILVAEDNADLRDLLVDFLKHRFGKDNLDLIVTENGEQALCKYEEMYDVTGEPDFVITDNQMPDRDGLYLTQQLRETYTYRKPIILYTAFCDKKTEAAYKEVGITAIFHKPYIDTLLAYVRGVIDGGT